MTLSLPHNPPLPARVPPLLHSKLCRYLHLLSVCAAGLVNGLYLYGSLALDAFDERRSDVDFVAVLTRKATPGDVALLRRVHEEVECQEPRWPLEGMGISRLRHALLTGKISSKVAAGEALLAHASPRRRKIVAEALVLRRGEPSLYRLRLQRAADAMAFIRSIIGECGSVRAPTVRECVTGR